MNIRTELACPPNHWAAVDDDTYDGPGSPIGTGRTEQEAKDDLMQQLSDGGVIRRSEIVGQRVGGKPKSEAEHFTQCATCSGYFDMRDLGQVMEHEGPLPHPAQDKPQ